MVWDLQERRLVPVVHVKIDIVSLEMVVSRVGCCC